ncbi:hypothetical protein FBQ97_15830 [Acidobacteria bacterium ACD]|nr:MAG: hypothetical protein EDX89_02085 [Acidobacteriota bacterium]MCE7956644.1 hypothetical protein [Acidobacteria bacterium ACB2]MDL1951269.1 hypothetical protein [Acidobacteria bacterium ACD]
MDDMTPKLLLLGRFVCFMTISYLLLDALVARLIRDPASKVRGFFALVASPVTRPVRRFLPEGATDDQVRWASIGLVALVWVLLLVLPRLASG